jgi:diamine N-acetyltransferase
MTDITLRKINMKNLHECLNLKLKKRQKNFVASNMYSLAEAKADNVSVPLAIYHGCDMVGFTMYWYDRKNKRGCIDRLMIDKKYQRKGYGKAAMVKVMERLKKNKGCRRIVISYIPENKAAEKLYLGLGFKKTGRTTGQGEELENILSMKIEK